MSGQADASVDTPPRPSETASSVQAEQSSTSDASHLPRLPFDLWEHTVAIASYWTVMVLTSGILPVAGYYGIEYGTNLSLSTNFSIWLSITAVVSLYSLVRRSWALYRRTPNCKPSGVTSQWAFDFFNWNFLLGFIALTALISAGSSVTSWPAVSLPIAVVLLYVCLELVLVQILMAFNLTLPFRLSSIPPHGKLRSGSSIIVEDIIAVDGGAGQSFRQTWNDRYERSAPLRLLLMQMDLLWGISGLMLVAAIFGLVFGVDNGEVGYVVGWLLPWTWAAVVASITFWMSKAMLKREAAQKDSVSG